MIIPSFFIVGAPKCGTTALSKYLNAHPDIFIPDAKELYYFDQDLNTAAQAQSIDEYMSLFDQGAGKICGEGTTTYLYSAVAAQRIYTFNPQARIIIMLRNPVDVMYSFHSQLLYNGSSETVDDFEQAIALEPQRKQGIHIPQKCAEPRLLLYRELARFALQVERYLNIFPRENIKIILFEEFSQNTPLVFREVLEFVGADPGFKMDFVRMNRNKKVRHKGIQQLVKYPPAKVLEVGKYFLPLPQSVRRSLLEGTKALIKRMNTQNATRLPLSPTLRLQLINDLSEDMGHLSRLIGQDLSHWHHSPVLD